MNGGKDETKLILNGRPGKTVQITGIQYIFLIIKSEIKIRVACVGNFNL